MSDFEFSVQRVEDDGAPFAVIYGPAGTGKTTLAASADRPIFLFTENGAGELRVNQLKKGTFESYEEFIEALRYLYKNADDIDFGTVVIDSIDHLEPLVWDYVCRANEWSSIEQPGYGKGYIECDKAWQKILAGLRNLQEKKGIAIIAIAHDIIRQVNDPFTDSNYDAHELKLHKRAVALWKENATMIGLLKNTVIVDEKTKKAKGGTTPSLHVRPNAAYTAKTRYRSMPKKLQINVDDGWKAVSEHIPFYNKGG